MCMGPTQAIEQTGDIRCHGVNTVAVGRLVAQARATVVKSQDREAPCELLNKGVRPSGPMQAVADDEAERGPSARQLVTKRHAVRGQKSHCAATMAYWRRAREPQPAFRIHV